MLIISTRLLKNTKISAIALFPFVLLRHSVSKTDEVLVNHEKIHLRQQLELLVVFFYFWYVVEYFVRLIALKNRFLAYKAISFEREAFAMESDPHYLKNRKMWSFCKYL